MDFSIHKLLFTDRDYLSHPARDAWILAANYSSGVPQIEVASRTGCVDLSIKYDFINFEFDSRIPQGMRGFENM